MQNDMDVIKMKKKIQVPGHIQHTGIRIHQHHGRIL